MSTRSKDILQDIWGRAGLKVRAHGLDRTEEAWRQTTPQVLRELSLAAWEAGFEVSNGDANMLVIGVLSEELPKPPKAADFGAHDKVIVECTSDGHCAVWTRTNGDDGPKTLYVPKKAAADDVELTVIVTGHLERVVELANPCNIAGF